MTPPLALWTGANSFAEVDREHLEDHTGGAAGNALQRSAPQRALIVLPTPALTLEQACRLLNVLPTAAWEVIETARRQLVARAQPDKLLDLTSASRETLQEEARRVNLASQTLFEMRLGTVLKTSSAVAGDDQVG